MFRKLKSSWLIVPGILLFSLSAQARPGQILRLSGQNKSMTSGPIWKRIVMKEIEEREHKAQIPRLSSMELKPDDLECRVWIGFGLAPLKGFVIRRVNSKWSGLFLPSIKRLGNQSTLQKVIGEPKSGWNSFWKSLVELGITAPADDARRGGGLDGQSVVVEIKEGISYKAYMFMNPQDDDSAEAKAIMRIIRILSEEFEG
jgi:hypothetical protein